MDDTDTLSRKLEEISESLLTQISRSEGASGKDTFPLREAARKRHLEEVLREEKTIVGANEVVVLRRWNSFTPAITRGWKPSRGGGYFLSWQGKGIVIDPGVHFTENFFIEGFRVCDIDAVAITHAHYDHTAALEAIYTLIYEFNDRIENEAREAARRKAEEQEIEDETVIEALVEKETKDVFEVRGKKLDLLLNLGTFKKYAGWLDLKGREIGRIYALEAGKPFILNDYQLEITPTKAMHDEIVDNKYCVGLIFNKITDSSSPIAAFTSDTGWSNCIGEQYCAVLGGLLFIHLGSFHAAEKEHARLIMNDEELEKCLKDACLCQKHLDLIGVLKLLDKVKPRLAILSEFDEQLPHKIRTILADEITSRIVSSHQGYCIAGDIGLRIRLSDLQIKCITKHYAPPSQINTLTKEDALFYVCKDCLDNKPDEVDRCVREKFEP
jgi:hypothetical protein